VVEMELEGLEVWMEVVQLVLQNAEFVKYKNQLEHPNISSKSISVK
jgi:hypothetical protein